MVYVDARPGHAFPFDRTMACVHCHEPVGWEGIGVIFLELAGMPYVCSRCWLQALTGEATRRAWSDSTQKVPHGEV